MRGEEIGILAFVLILLGVFAILAVVSIEPSKTVNVFTSLNITKAAPGVTIGINLAHGNFWTAIQTFDNSMGAGSGDIALTIGHYLCLDQTTCGTTSSIFFETGDGIFVLDSGHSGNGNNPCKLDFRTNAIERLGVDTNACGSQGTAPITSYESINPSASNSVNLGSSSLLWNNINFGNFINEYGTSGAANPILQITAASAGIPQINFGIGTSNPVDLSISRQSGFYFNDSLLIQSLHDNQATEVGIAPIGSGTESDLILYNGPPASATQTFQFVVNRFNSPGSNIVDRANSGHLSSIYFVQFTNGVGGVNVFALSPTGVGNTQGYQTIIAAALSNGNAVTTINLPVTEPDTTYAVVCTPNGSTALGAWWVDTKATGSFHFHTTNNAGAASTVDCSVTHQ